MDIKDQVKKLNKALEGHRDDYYKKAETSISDAEYDALERELAEIVKANPHLAEYAPVLKTVGSDLTAQGRVKHAVPMRSIENQYTVEDLIAWVEKVLAKYPDAKFCLEPKFDGISVSLVYEHGYLVRALTRGTGEEGEDITAQAKQVKHIPHTLPNMPINLIVRGELVMQNSTLERINRESAEKGGKQYSSTRNLTAGTMKQRDLSIVADRDIWFMPWDLISDHPLLMDSGKERLEFLGYNGFPSFIGDIASDVESVKTTLAKRLKDRENMLRKVMSLETDGVVIKVDSQKLRKELGVASKYTNWQVCYKPQSASGTTYLREIQWQVGRTAKITPVAKCDVVVLAGANVTSASLNNITYIRNMGLKLGAKVEMLRSGDVIPQIVRVIDDGDEDILEPSQCPVCQSATVSRDEGGQGIMQLFCTNSECPAVLQGYLEFLGRREVLEVDGLGPEMARVLVENKYARNLVELFEFQAEAKKTMDTYAMDRKFVDRMREKGFDATLPKMLRSLEKAKTAPWPRWIKALGIDGIGETFGKSLAEFYLLDADGMKTLYLAFARIGAVDENDPNDKKRVQGIGPAKIKALEEWGLANRDACLRLYELGVRPTPVEVAQVVEGAPLAGTVFCITGEFGEERIPLTKKLESLGAVAKTGVSKNINLLIVGSAAGKSKLAKATQLGIKQVGKDWLEKVLADNGMPMKADSFAAEEA
jgi:DNA ligase (NAD+)